MSAITIPNDEDFLSRLRNVTSPAELCTPAGQVVGRFVPMASIKAELEADACPYSVEELSAMLAQPDGEGRALREILEDLQSR